MQSQAATVAEYLESLSADRRAVLDAVRKVVLKNLDPVFTECMNYGMIGYVVPHSVYPPGYHCDPSLPLPFGGLAAQKNAYSLYLMSLYGDADELARFTKAWKATGKKLDMGKACIRFKKVDDLALEVVGEAIRRVPVKAYLEHYIKATAGSVRGAAKAPAKKAAAAKAKPRPAKRAKKTVTKKAPGRRSAAR